LPLTMVVVLKLYWKIPEASRRNSLQSSLDIDLQNQGCVCSQPKNWINGVMIKYSEAVTIHKKNVQRYKAANLLRCI
jgi:hypothetical protein